MPKYLLRYLVETPIHHHSDLSFTVAGHVVTFCFSQRNDKDSSVTIQIEVEGSDANDAQTKAAGTLIPPVLDSLAFSTGAPLLLQECNLILKSEPGARDRRALYVDVSRINDPVHISSKHAAESQRMLDRIDGSTLPLCWHRYAAHRGYALDRFLFQWLALEGLSGTVQIPIPCSECGHVRTHSGTDRNRASELFRAANPEISPTDFNKEIWGKARNAVFHGIRYPQPMFLAQLNVLSAKLRRACEMSFCQEYGLPNVSRTVRGPSTWQLYLFISWQTTDPHEEYALDFPEGEVSKLGGHHENGEVGINAPQASGFSLLDMNKDYQGW